MILSDSHRFIVTLPQKCASGTLQVRLASVRDVEPYAQNKPCYSHELEKILSKHIAIEDIVKLRDFKRRKRYFRASFVRNPYDRVYSWFEWFKLTYKQRMASGGRVDLSKLKIERNEDPDGVEANFLKNTEWMGRALEYSEGDFNLFLRGNQNRYSCASDFTHHWGKPWVNFIGRVEVFEASFAEFCEKVGFDAGQCHGVNDQKSYNAVQLPRAIPISVEDYKYLNHYSEESVYIVNQILKNDFALLGYQEFAL